MKWSITPVLPDPAKATGAAAIVAPGGGFMALSTQTEGFQVARALADRGIAAFVISGAAGAIGGGKTLSGSNLTEPAQIPVRAASYECRS